MARTLSLAFDAVQRSVNRRPAYQVLVYDVRSTELDTTPSTIGDVVSGAVLPAIVGPRDFTDDVVSVTLEERAGDYITGGLVADTCSMVIDDPDLTLDPVDGASGRWLRQRNIVVVIEGDTQVPTSDWKITFVGKITGQPGLDSGRVAGTNRITVKALGREADFIKTSDTSDAFNEGTSYLEMMEQLTTVDMGLGADEVVLPNIGANLTEQRTTQFVEQPAIISVAQIAFVDGRTPAFNGEGVLVFRDSNISKGPVRVYDEDDGLVRNISRPIIEASGFNEVIVLGLEPELSQAVGERQVLAQAGVTLGFFTKRKKLRVRFSEDNRMQAQNTELKVRASINDGLIPLGSEDWDPNIDGVSGLAIGGTIRVRSPFKPGLTVLITVTQVASAVIPDVAPTFGGPTAPIGKAAWSAVFVILLTILQTVGTGQYEIVGEPVEFIYAEIKAVARVKGVAPVDRRSTTIENHLLDSQTLCNQAAVRALNLAQARQNVRNIEMVHDLLLEPDDIFEMPDGKRYMVQSITRTLERGSTGSLARVAAFEVTPGVFP